MRCRNYEDNEIVFFGSKGVNPITAYQDIIVPNNDILVDIDASKTIIGQNFKVVGFGETSNNPHVNLYDSDNHMFYRSYLSKETKELRGVLTSPVAKIWVGSNTYDEVHLYLYPYQVKVPSNTFLENQSGVATSLTQRLSIIKGELWYKVSHGLPSLKMGRSAGMCGATVTRAKPGASGWMPARKRYIHAPTEEYMW